MTKKYLAILFFFIELVVYGQKVSEKNKLMAKIDSIKTLLQGTWFGQEYDEHAVFYIKGDTISYVEHFDKYKYSISKNSIDIITNPNTFKTDFVIKKITRDSLIMEDMRFSEVEKKIYWRSIQTMSLPNKKIHERRTFEGTAITSDGKPLFIWDFAASESFYLDGLENWDNDCLNKKITVEGILIQFVDGKSVIKDWKIIEKH